MKVSWWFFAGIGLALGVCVPVGLSMRRDLEHKVDAVTVYKTRLDHYCGLQHLFLETLQHDLEHPANADLLGAGKIGFQNLIADDFHNVMLCMDDGVSRAALDPGDQALFCSQVFRDDVPCMIGIVRLVRMYLREP